jgi:hypothetical protein
MVLKNWNFFKRTARKLLVLQLQPSGSLMGLKKPEPFDDQKFDNLKLTKKHWHTVIDLLR